jgi:hypothetical protein
LFLQGSQRRISTTTYRDHKIYGEGSNIKSTLKNARLLYKPNIRKVIGMLTVVVLSGAASFGNENSKKIIGRGTFNLEAKIPRKKMFYFSNI